MTNTINEKFVAFSDWTKIGRSAWISLLSKAPANEVTKLWEQVSRPDIENNAQIIRRPETGMVMVRGRIGGAGNSFNLGEMTVTRCAIRLASGETGISYVAGRNKAHARIAAIVDAMMQTTEFSNIAIDAILDPLEKSDREKKKANSRKAKATQVEFFTMVTGR
ncbi:MAG: phnG [Hyphomonadaceae bacterium]|nr:MAG: phnG [Hyphomonadaceae bacterium]KAF0183639.1 MAG: phnG [Hyphomonadaceae bacterium]